MYYAAVLLRGWQSSQTPQCQSPFVQRALEARCASCLHVHFRSINVLPLSPSTWSCRAHPWSRNCKKNQNKIKNTPRWFQRIKSLQLIFSFEARHEEFLARVTLTHFFFHHSPHVFNLYKLCTRRQLLNRHHSTADKHSRSLFLVVNPPTSCTFSTRAFLFLFILTISTQENHRSDADTHTAYYVHKADPVFFSPSTHILGISSHWDSTIDFQWK